MPLGLALSFGVSTAGSSRVVQAEQAGVFNKFSPGKVKLAYPKEIYEAEAAIASAAAGIEKFVSQARQCCFGKEDLASTARVAKKEPQTAAWRLTGT